MLNASKNNSMIHRQYHTDIVATAKNNDLCLNRKMTSGGAKQRGVLILEALKIVAQNTGNSHVE
jgi:hypothetical protein